MVFKAKIKLYLLITAVAVLTILLVVGALREKNFGEIGKIRYIEVIKEAKKDKVQEIMKKLSLEQKVGQLILTGIDREIVIEKEKEIIKNAEIGGFVLLGKNIQSPEQVRNLTSEIQAIATSSATPDSPILISVDQEGGRVTRINFPGFETTAQWQIESEARAYDVGKNRGRQLKNLGIDVNFSPVVEALRDDNSYLGQTGRYFAGDEDMVSELSGAMIKGMAEAGVVGVAKHFPGGLGRIPLNPHDILPEIEITKEELEKDLYTFKKLIGKSRGVGNIEAIMVTHLLYPKIDEKNPASASKIFIKDILRDKLGFDGVVVIDDLGMGAVVKSYKPEDYGLKAILSGADMVIVIDTDIAEKVKQGVKEAVESGVLPEERLNEAVGRVLRLREEIGLLRK